MVDRNFVEAVLVERLGSSRLMAELGSWAFDLVAAGSSVGSVVGTSRLD